MQELRAENPGYPGLGLPMVRLSAKEGEEVGCYLCASGKTQAFGGR